MSATQLELTARRPVPTEQEAADVICWLRSEAHDYSDGWMTRRELEAVTGIPDRTIRQIASKHPDKILSGQQGYKYLPAATPEELRRNVARLRSQAREMELRAYKTERAWHRLAHQQHNQS